MTRTIIDNQGTIDKYIGDSIMAFWGAPRPLQHHAVQACLAAIKCRNFSRIMSEEQRKKGRTPMGTRIGLNTGVAILGNIGFDARLNYTAMGDMVNLASRLEGLNKFYGTQILASESTWQLARDTVDMRFIDVVAVKGKQIPVRIYEVIGERGGMAAAQAALVAGYEEAMALHLSRRFREAAARFEQLVLAHPEDHPSALMLERSRRFADAPPPDEWQGEFVMESK
jgi:adenylate cyclase